MANLITTGANAIQDYAAQYLLVPSSNIGISGFIFSYLESTGLEANSNITHHYLEDGSFITDSSTNDPRRINMKGYVGEISTSDNILKSTYSKFVKTSGSFAQLCNQLSIITSQSLVDELIQSSVNSVENPDSSNIVKSTVENSSNLKLENIKSDLSVSDITNIAGQLRTLLNGTSRQGRAVSYFEALRRLSITLTISTPFGVFNNMVLTSYKVNTEGTSSTYSDIYVELTEIRTVNKASSVKFDSLKYSPVGGFNLTIADKEITQSAFKISSEVVDVFGAENIRKDIGNFVIGKIL